MSKSKLISKVKKLLDHAKSCKEIGSIEEATIFANHADQIIANSGLSYSDIEGIQEYGQIIETGPEDMITFGDDSTNDKSWEITLITAISRNYKCEPIFFLRKEDSPKGTLSRASIIGKAENIDKVKSYFPVILKIFTDKAQFWIDHLKKALNERAFEIALQGDFENFQIQDEALFLLSFKRGATYGYYTYCKENEERQRKMEEQQLSDESKDLLQSLVKVEKSEVDDISDYINNEHNTEKSTSTTPFEEEDQRAYALGYRFGRSFDFHLTLDIKYTPTERQLK